MKPFLVHDAKRVLHSTQELPVICTCSEAGLLLRCTPEAIARMAREGKIKGVKRGSVWLFRKDDLIAYVEDIFGAERE